MLKITAKQQLMKEIVDILSVLTTEAKLIWGEKGLSVSVVDGSHVALLSATIADECFETYEAEPVEIGLDLVKMRDLLTLAGPSDLVQMDFDEAVGAINVRVGEVLMILRGIETGGMDNPNLPDLEFKSKATIDSEKLSRALRAAKFVGGEVDLTMDKNHLAVSVTVEAGEGVNVKFESGELSELTCASPTHSTYSLQYLGELTKKLAGGLTAEVSLEFEEKYPLRLTWMSNDGGAKWIYFLAPRIVND